MNTIKGKLIITGVIKLITGLHIGTSGDFSAIGAVDNMVIRDTISKRPMIPGSSLKGKMRYLLARTKYNTTLELSDIKKEHESIKRLFGSSEPVTLSRLQFQDMILSDKSVNFLENADLDLPYTEIKYENTIDRAKCEANPRQQERVPAGAEFDFKIVYNIENEDEFTEDMDNLILMMQVLEDDYLGGHGTRGYGRIKFQDLSAEIKCYTKENQEKLNIINEQISEFKKNLESKVG